MAGKASTEEENHEEAIVFIHSRSQRCLVLTSYEILLNYRPTNFYKGKTIRFVVGLAPGGGYDLSARTVGRHMGKHIPRQSHHRG